MKINKSWLIIVCLVLTISLNINIVKAENNTPNDRIKEATKVLKEISKQEDADSLTHLLKEAKGVVIFPKVIKGGFMLGGRYGKGLLLKHNAVNNTWYGPYFVEMKGLSYGFQIGVESIGLVLVITNERGLNNFKEDNLTLGGGLSISAGPIGRNTEAATDINLEAAIYSYSMSKGAFAGASIEGANVNNDKEANKSYWQNSLTPTEIFTKKAYDQRITPLINTIEELISTAD
ncbi:lipid-binding SYLF domain-containing protein [Sporohalobacter salinus]|uniref:lipid-binding SYLF domain-containing protein n=1 Tax=Sporohalobacter salinus TaxID=1494606 RepID=UPI0019622491|nr:lipid-binding SYLF domain-containing protein [Sporohalobacter salinus]MBM7624484.1 lipid-binding SYLF domain-containing protein [Sporohalobacter salinus]